MSLLERLAKHMPKIITIHFDDNTQWSGQLIHAGKWDEDHADTDMTNTYLVVRSAHGEEEDIMMNSDVTLIVIDNEVIYERDT